MAEPVKGLVGKTPVSRIRKWIRRLIVLASGITAVVGVLTLAHFPWDVDQADTSTLSDSSRLFYEQAYALSSPKINYGAAKVSKPTESPHHQPVSEFMRQYGLEEKRVLEIGAGAGALQDVVDSYVGLDIAESARSNFHKPFVQGSATNLPFEDGQFDVIWTLWTLEHVPNPEKALSEMRRVVTKGGYLYVAPMWNVPWWRPRGDRSAPVFRSRFQGQGGPVGGGSGSTVVAICLPSSDPRSRSPFRVVVYDRRSHETALQEAGAPLRAVSGAG